MSRDNPDDRMMKEVWQTLIGLGLLALAPLVIAWTLT